MNKQELLREVEMAVARGEIHADEIQTLFKNAPIASSTSVGVVGKQFNYTDLFYYIGGFIVFIGLVILIGQHWREYSDMVKILITLGTGIIFYVAAYSLSFGGQRKVANAFFLVSILISPFGYYILFDTLGVRDGAILNALTALCSGIQFGISWYAIRGELFALSTIAYTTWFYFAITSFLLTSPGITNGTEEGHLFAWRVLVLGLTYLVLAFYFSKKYSIVPKVLNSFGSLGFLAPAMYFTVEDKGIWIAFFPLILIAFFYLSVSLRRGAYLTWAVVFLIAYIGWITAEYFSSAIGWPLALVFMGLVVIASGYFGFRVNRKYIQS